MESSRLWRLLVEEPNLRIKTWRIGASRFREVLASLVVPKFYS